MSEHEGEGPGGLVWKWVAFAAPNFVGADGRLEAVGASGIEYGIAHFPRKGRRREGWQLVYSIGVGHVSISGRGDVPDHGKEMAARNEADTGDRMENLRRSMRYPVSPRVRRAPARRVPS